MFFSILREPLAQFISSWDFYDTRHFGFDSLTDLLEGNNEGNEDDFESRRRAAIGVHNMTLADFKLDESNFATMADMSK